VKRFRLEIDWMWVCVLLMVVFGGLVEIIKVWKGH